MISWIQNLAQSIWDIVIAFAVWLLDVIVWGIKYAFWYVVDTLYNVVQGLINAVVGLFPSLAAFDTFEVIRPGLEIANVYLPVNECFLLLFGVLTFSAAWSAFRLLMKAIPTIG
ncbi:MAG: hypothetical protein AAGD07_00585 [Planctomycetota bacterium]